MRRLGPLFAISLSTVCRVLQRLGPLPVLAPVSRPAEAIDRLWTVDGALPSGHDHAIGASGRDYLPANVQIVIDTDRHLVNSPIRSGSHSLHC